jgi:hypothetical protein
MYPYAEKNTRICREKYPNMQRKIPEYAEKNTRICREKYLISLDTYKKTLYNTPWR